MNRGRKLFAILLSLAMVGTMMPAFTLTAGAYPIKSWELVGGTIYASQLEEGAFLSLESDTTLVLDADIGLGSISGDKKLTIKDEGMLKDMQQKKSGTLDITVGGIASTLYYGPIDGMNWSLAVVTPKDDVQKPTLTMGLVLLVIAVLGIIITWIICRRISYAKEN